MAAQPIDQQGGALFGGTPPGSNQYFNGGTPMPGNNPSPGAPPSFGPMMFSNPYQVPGSTGTTPGYGASGGGMAPGGPTGPGASHNLGHGIIATGLQFPGLGENFSNYLMGQVGSGVSPFNLSTMLPTGGSTQPGQLTAGENPLLQQLQNFFMSGGQQNSNMMPGFGTLSNIANNGVSALPEWQSMIQAQQQNIEQNQANLAEQFGSMGDLAGSPFGTAMGNYMSQTTADQNALLGQLQQSNIQNIQMPALQNLFGSMMGGSQQMAGGLQQLDQSAVSNMYNEFQRTQPQNNPMNQYISQFASLFPPTTKTPTTSNEVFGNINGTLGALSGAGMSTTSSDGSSSSFTF